MGRLTDRVGKRPVYVVGIALFGAGHLLASFSTEVRRRARASSDVVQRCDRDRVLLARSSVLRSQLWQLYLTQGVIVGVSYACCYLPCISVVSLWFDRRRGLAVGVTVSGSGLGGLAMAPILQVLPP